jgi:SAM-dependent methyltransferase
LKQLVVKIFRNSSRGVQDAIYRQMTCGKESTKESTHTNLVAIFDILRQSVRPEGNGGGQEWITSQIADYLDAKYPDLLQPDKTIVDIGGGEGNVLAGLGRRGGIPKEQLFCVEQSPEDSTWATTYKRIHENEVTYVEWSNRQLTLPLLAPNQADLLMCMVTLHHMPAEVARMVIVRGYSYLKPGGVMLVKEHDISTPELLCAVHWEHHLYHLSEYLSEYLPESHVEADLQDYLDHHYVAHYKSKESWVKQMQEVGFVLVEERTRTMGPIISGKTDSKNTTNLYWQVWNKPQ